MTRLICFLSLRHISTEKAMRTTPARQRIRPRIMRGPEYFIWSSVRAPVQRAPAPAAAPAERRRTAVRVRQQIMCLSDRLLTRALRARLYYQKVREDTTHGDTIPIHPPHWSFLYCSGDEADGIYLIVLSGISISHFFLMCSFYCVLLEKSVRSGDGSPLLDKIRLSMYCKVRSFVSFVIIFQTKDKLTTTDQPLTASPDVCPRDVCHRSGR